MASALIQPNGEYDVFPVGDDGGEPVRLRCLDVAQRNWSRVGKGEFIASQDGERYCFIKQYLDKAGNSHPDHWEYEKDGALIAAAVLQGVVHVPVLKYRNSDLLLNVFEYVEVLSVDELLRADPPAFERCITVVIERMAASLEALQKAGPQVPAGSLNIKQRSYGGLNNAMNFKGFEIRNAGVPTHATQDIGPADLVLFDFVRPYLAPVEEAAAKVFVSIGLLNWGSPLSRFVRGPDNSLLARALPILGPWLDAQAIAAELDLQEGFRLGELKGAGNVELAMKRLGTAFLGKRYLRKLRRWCELNIA